MKHKLLLSSFVMTLFFSSAITAYADPATISENVIEEIAVETELADEETEETAIEAEGEETSYPTFTDEEADSKLPYGEISGEAYTKLAAGETINVITTTYDGSEEARVTLAYDASAKRLTVTGAQKSGIITKFVYKDELSEDDENESYGIFAELTKIKMVNISVIDSYSISNNHYENLSSVTLDTTSSHYFRPYAFYNTNFKFDFGDCPTYLYEKAFCSPINEQTIAIILPRCLRSMEDGAFYECFQIDFETSYPVNKDPYNRYLFTARDNYVYYGSYINYNESPKKTLMAYNENNVLCHVDSDTIDLSDKDFEFSIGKYFGFNCPNKIKNLVFSGEISLKDCALMGNIRLKILQVDGLKEIGDYAFYECSSIKTLPTITSKNIGEKAFYGCSGLTDVDLSESTGEIGTSAFENCENLTTVKAPNISSIGERAFYGCSGLTDVDLSESTGEIGTSAFENCTGLTNINATNATVIGASAFEKCTNLKRINVPNVSTVGERAFYDCSNLTDIVMTNATDIASDIFSRTRYPQDPYYYLDDSKNKNTVLNFDFSSADNADFLKPLLLEGWGIGSTVKISSNIYLPTATSSYRDFVLITDDGWITFNKKFVSESGKIYKGGAKTAEDSIYTVVGYGSLQYKTKFNNESSFEYYDAEKYNASNPLAQTTDDWGGTTYFNIGKEVTLKEASVNGYSDNGWFLDEGLTQSVSSLSANEYYGEDVILYKEFTPNTYNIYLSENEYFLDGTEGLQTSEEKIVSANSITFDFGEKALSEKIKVDPCLKGYVFQGWFDSTGTKLSDEKYYDSDITLYSAWAPCDGHTYDNGVVTEESTCVTRGTKLYTCTKCKETYEKKLDINEDNHKNIQKNAINSKSATCKEEGYTGDSYCFSCQKVVATDGEVIPKTNDHDKVIVNKKDATKDAEGYTGDTVCSVCGMEFETGEVIQKLKDDQSSGSSDNDNPSNNPSGNGGNENGGGNGNGSGNENGNTNGTETQVVQNGESYRADDGVNTVQYNNGSVKLVASTKANTKTYTIPDTVTIYGKTYKVTEVDSQFLRDNKTITTLKMGNNIKVIGKEAFKNCKNLKSVTIGKNVTTISDSAFEGCKKLKKITIPSKVKKIGKKAFYNCTSLKSVTIKTTSLKSVGKSAFKKIAKKATIKVPKKKYAAYKKLLKGKTTSDVRIKK